MLRYQDCGPLPILFSPLLSLPHLSSLSPFFSLSLLPLPSFPTVCLSLFLSSLLHLSSGLSLSLSLSLSLWILTLSQYSNLINQRYGSLWVSSLRGHFRERSWSMVEHYFWHFFPQKLIRTLRGYPLSNSHLPPLRLDRLSAIFSTTILTPPSSFPCFMRQFLCSTPNVDE